MWFDVKHESSEEGDVVWAFIFWKAPSANDGSGTLASVVMHVLQPHDTWAYGTGRICKNRIINCIGCWD